MHSIRNKKVYFEGREREFIGKIHEETLEDINFLFCFRRWLCSYIKLENLFKLNLFLLFYISKIMIHQ